MYGLTRTELLKVTEGPQKFLKKYSNIHTVNEYIELKIIIFGPRLSRSYKLAMKMIKGELGLVFFLIMYYEKVAVLKIVG